MDSFEKAALPRGLPQARRSYTGTPMGKWTLLTVPQRGRSPGLSQIPSIQDLWQIRKALQWPRPSTAGQADTNPSQVQAETVASAGITERGQSVCHACQTLSELLMSHESFPAMLGILGVCEGCVCPGWTARLALALTCLPS